MCQEIVPFMEEKTTQTDDSAMTKGREETQQAPAPSSSVYFSRPGNLNESDLQFFGLQRHVPRQRHEYGQTESTNEELDRLSIRISIIVALVMLLFCFFAYPIPC